MSSEEKHYGDPATRERILDVAMELAAERGPAMRLVDVARGAGVSHQALYLHFGGREGLILALLPHMEQRFDLARSYAEVTGAANGRAALGAMVRFLGLLNRRLDKIGWVLEEAQHLDEGFGKDWRTRVTGLRKVIERDVAERLHREGRIRTGWSVGSATDLILALTSFGGWQHFTRDLAWSDDDYVTNVVAMLELSLLT